MTNVLTAELTAPGGWLAAVIPGRIAVVHDPEPDRELVARLWSALCGGDGIESVLDVLTRNGLASAPGFALAEWTTDDEGGSDCRFIVRGEAAVSVESAAGDEDIAARGVATWVERPVPGVRGFRVQCLASARSRSRVPFLTGAAWVSSLAFGSLAEGFADTAPGLRAEGHAVAPAPSGVADVQAASADSAGPAEHPRPADGPREGTADLGLTLADLEATVVAAGVPAQPVADEGPPETTGYDHLFGATLMRSVEDAAARPEPESAGGEPESPGGEPESVGGEPQGPGGEPDPARGGVGTSIAPPEAGATAQVPAVAASGLGDHDGLTVLSGDLRTMREAARVVESDSSASVVPPVQEDREALAAPAGFRLRLPDGGEEPIEGMVVVGRAPSVSRMGGGRVPSLVTVDSAEHDISRNHIQLTIEGGTVVVTDLHSRNGTVIALPGRAPQKLRAGEPTSVIAGTVIDLGSGVTLGVERA